jgi:tryptophan 2,3-dioxygenase
MISIDEYKKLKAKVEERKKAAAKAEGAYDEAMRRLKAAGFDTIVDAEAGLKQLREEEAEAEAAYEAELAAFNEKWKDKLA